MKKLIAAGAAALICGAAIAQTQVVAHRGFWKAASGAQNSIEALQRADSIGAYASEFDVWMTADSCLMVNHDRSFKGVTLEKAQRSELQGMILDNGEPMPTLAEYLAAAALLPNLRLVLELKEHADPAREDYAAKRIVGMLKDYGLLGRTDIISFSINACLAFKKECPSLDVYYLDGDMSPKKLKRLGLAGLDYHHSVLDAHPEWIEQAHELGLKVNVWTIDKPEDIKRFADAGVDFVTTNNPDQAIEIIGDSCNQ